MKKISTAKIKSQAAKKKVTIGLVEVLAKGFRYENKQYSSLSHPKARRFAK